MLKDFSDVTLHCVYCDITGLKHLHLSLSPVCLSVVLLLSVVSLGVSSQPITDGQRLFSIAVSRVQHLHLLAQRLFSDFVSVRQLDRDKKTQQRQKTWDKKVECNVINRHCVTVCIFVCINVYNFVYNCVHFCVLCLLGELSADGGTASTEQNLPAGFLQLRLHHQPHWQTWDTTQLCESTTLHNSTKYYKIQHNTQYKRI